MRSFISEDDIEQAILKRLQTKELNYDVLICDSDPAHKEDLNDGTNRRDKKQCALPEILKSSLYRLSPNIDKKYIDEQYLSKAIGRELPYKFAPRRSGDVVACYADPSKAKKELGWVATKTLDDMTADSYNWQKNNPNGYED